MSTPRIFVFGSNLRGIHGNGSAREAVLRHGAQRGVGVGRTGNAYAIPTKFSPYGEVLSLTTVAQHVQNFLQYATRHSELAFDVVKIGCGSAGYGEDEIAPLFAGAPDNVHLPEGWRS